MKGAVVMLSFESAGRIYRIGDLAKELERTPLTIKSWEKKGIIPKAKRDSRGWRYYTEDDLNRIKRLVKECNYFLEYHTT